MKNNGLIIFKNRQLSEKLITCELKTENTSIVVFLNEFMFQKWYP